MGIKIVGLNQIGKKDENMVREWNHTSGQWNGDTNDKGKLNSYNRFGFLFRTNYVYKSIDVSFKYY